MLSLSNPLVKLLLPILAIAAVYFIATKKLKYSLQQDLLLVTPKFENLLKWVVIFLIYMLISDKVLNWRGPWNFQPWRVQSLFTSIARVLAVVILGPVSEELIFRGLLLKKLTQSNLNKWISLIIVSAFWAGIHVDYSITVIILIFFEGILLGLSLYSSRSLIVPIILHIIWNLYAVW